MVLFADVAKPTLPLSSSKDALLASTTWCRTNAGSQAYMDTGVNAAAAWLQQGRADAAKLIVLIAAGAPSNEESARLAFQSARDAGITTVAILVESGLSTQLTTSTCAGACTSTGSTMYSESFCKTQPNYNCCPAGWLPIDTLRDCVTALEGVQEWPPVPVGYKHNMAPEADETRPSGCYVWAPDGKYNVFHFNPDPVGAPNKDATPVCKKGAAASASAVIGTWASTAPILISNYSALSSALSPVATQVCAGVPNALTTSRPAKSGVSSTKTPTSRPSVAPSFEPTATLTSAPSFAPTAPPSFVPSRLPTTTSPTARPTASPTAAPTAAPTGSPTAAPSAAPTDAPSGAPSTRKLTTGTPTRNPTWDYNVLRPTCSKYDGDTCSLCGTDAISKAKGCTATMCYDGALSASGASGSRNATKAREWCNRRNTEGCGCQWVSKELPHSAYEQTRADKGSYGYCCYTSCTSTGNQGAQCCSGCGATPAPTAAPTAPPTAMPTVAAVETTEPLPECQLAGGCCMTCRVGKACGNSCISADKTCLVGPGCACDARTVYNTTTNLPIAPVDSCFKGCCKTCSTGKACGNTCIQKTDTCHIAAGTGCACDATPDDTCQLFPATTEMNQFCHAYTSSEASCVSHGVCRWVNLAVQTGTGVKMCKPKCRALLINEVAAGSAIGDDYIELYAREAVDLKDYRLSDSDQGSTVLATKSDIMAAGTYRVFKADNSQLKFRLDKAGETVSLAYAENGAVVIDEVTYGSDGMEGGAFGRYPGGSEGGDQTWLVPTRGSANVKYTVCLAGSNVVCTSTGTTMYQQTFCKTKTNANCCPRGYAQISTLADCVSAARDTSEWGSPTPAYKVAPEVDRAFPAGCYIYSGDKRFYFNEDPLGAASTKATPVCKKL